MCRVGRYDRKGALDLTADAAADTKLGRNEHDMNLVAHAVHNSQYRLEQQRLF